MRLFPAAGRVLRALLVGVAVSATVTGLSRVGVLAGWETRAVDTFLFLRDPVRAPAIVVVALDEDAFRALGERRPISRRYLAELSDALLRSVSVLFSDLRGFTTVAERLPPQRISEMMNEYFTAMIDVILARRGIVQDFVGDAILAVFGAPLPDPDHAGHAVAAAREMHAAFARLNEGWVAQGRPALAMGIAINTGQVFAGNVGSPRKKKYAVIGDTVNTVTRMEGLNRDFATSILISRATFEAIRGRGEVRPRGAVAVRGRAQPVEVFELLPATAGAGGGHE